MSFPRDPDDPSLPGWLLYRFFHGPRNQLRRRNPDFWLYLLLRRVRGGPFAGLRYVGDSPNPQIAPFLLGLNEKEIWPFVQRLLAPGFDVFVNVGAAEGYYAVGVARFSSVPRVISYEGHQLGRILTRFMARKNGVAGRVDVRGACTPELLQEALAPFARPALLLDVEGYEEELADPARVPALRRATMIVELHESQRPMADILRPRFTATHDIGEAWTSPRRLEDLPNRLWPATMFFSRDRLLELGTEHRNGPMRWWMLTPKPAPPC
ncbi:MAG TPA: hypothetical protein VMI53_00710 [Opitutaceae bacterium]|nr:hypothetical protein [Opitutaceae bacterium]